MPDGKVAQGFLHIVAECGREERFTFKILSECGACENRRLVAWTPGALIPMVIHGCEHPCLLDPLVQHVEQNGMPVQPRAHTGD